jgi:hypothetical protein
MNHKFIDYNICHVGQVFSLLWLVDKNDKYGSWNISPYSSYGTNICLSVNKPSGVSTAGLWRNFSPLRIYYWKFSVICSLTKVFSPLYRSAPRSRDEKNLIWRLTHILIILNNSTEIQNHLRRHFQLHQLSYTHRLVCQVSQLWANIS